MADSEGAGAAVEPQVTISNLNLIEVEDPRDKTPLGLFVNSSAFQNFTLFIIVLNGIWIGIDVDHNHPLLEKNGKLPLEPASTVIEHLFCVYFTFEIGIRIVAFGSRNLTDGMFAFDFLLVLFMVIETWVMVIIEAIVGGEGGGLLSKFSCLRLLRLTRLTRLLNSLPELQTLVRGMLNAARAVTAVLFFMVMIMYIFAIVFTAQIGDVNAPERKQDPYDDRDMDPTAVELFGSMGDSMMSLFTRGLLGDNLAQTLEAIKDRGGKTFTCEVPDDPTTCSRVGGELWLMWVFILFMIISAFCILNMLVGILCEVIDGTAKDELEAANVDSLRSSIVNAFIEVDTLGEEFITKNEWQPMRKNEELRSSFVGIGVEAEFLDLRLDQMTEHLFGKLDKHKLLDQDTCWMPEGEEQNERGGVPLEVFVNRILEIRPDVAASYLDLEILQTRAERDERAFDAQCDNIEKMLLQRMNKVSTFADGAVLPMASPTSVDDAVLESLANSTTTTTIEVEEFVDSPKNGASSTADDWIQGLSTAALFGELRHRAGQSGSSVPAMDVD